MKNKKNTWLLLILIMIGIFLPLNTKAASAVFKVSSSNSTVVVGKSFTVTVKVSSTAALGTAEYTLSYDNSKVKYTGNSHVVLYPSNSSTKSYTKSFTFKAIASGSTKISVKAAEAYAYSEAPLGISTYSTTVKTITQAQLEASYSANDYLKALSVNEYTLNPAFNKNTTEYHIYLDSDVTSIVVKATKEHANASVKGTGTIPVSEGDNKINIIVTSQKGTTRTYSIIATVVDKNPIEISIDDKKYTIVKRDSILTSPDTYNKSEVIINEQKIPAFHSILTGYSLVGLKDENSDVYLAIYNENSNTYTIYNEIQFEGLTFFPTKFNKPIDNYIKSSIIINDIPVEGYKLTTASKYALIYGVNVETGKSSTYMYDSEENTIQRYNDEETKILTKEKESMEFILLVLVVGMGIELLLIIILIFSNIRRSKKKKKARELKKINNIAKTDDKTDTKLAKTKEIKLESKKENKTKKS